MTGSVRRLLGAWVGGGCLVVLAGGQLGGCRDSDATGSSRAAVTAPDDGGGGGGSDDAAPSGPGSGGDDVADPPPTCAPEDCYELLYADPEELDSMDRSAACERDPSPQCAAPDNALEPPAYPPPPP